MPGTAQACVLINTTFLILHRVSRTRTFHWQVPAFPPVPRAWHGWQPKGELEHTYSPRLLEIPTGKGKYGPGPGLTPQVLPPTTSSPRSLGKSCRFSESKSSSSSGSRWGAPDGSPRTLQQAQTQLMSLSPPAQWVDKSNIGLGY